MSDRLALIIANSEFDDPKLSRLVTPSHDAEALAQVLSDPAIGGFDVTLQVNETMPVVRREIARLYQRRKKGDLLLLYYSGHGIKDDYGALYLAVKDTETDIIGATAIDAAFVRDQLDKSSSQRKIVVLDCCHSGAFAGGAKATLGSSVGAQEAFAGSGYGRVILTASNSFEFAWEGGQLLGEAEKTSVFTHFLVQGLQTGEADLDGDGQISLDELYDYAYEQVVTGSKQTPQKWAQKVEGRIIIARNPVPPAPKVSLPGWITEALASGAFSARLAAVGELNRLSKGEDQALAAVARAELERLSQEDENSVVRGAAAGALGVSPTAVPAKPSPAPPSLIVEKAEPEPEAELRPSLVSFLSVEPQIIDVGGEAKWTFRLHNNGDDDLRDVTVQHGSRGLEPPFALAVGKERRFTFTTTYKTEGRKTERVTVSGIASSGETVRDEAKATVQVRPQPELHPSLALKLSVKPQTVDAGGEATWTVTLRNDGDEDLRHVTVRRGRMLLDDPFDLAAGKRRHFTFTTTYETKGKKSEKVTVTGIASSGESVRDEASATVQARPPRPVPPQVELVRVPAGEFLMGSDPAKDKDARDKNEQPQHRVYVSEFYIGKYPVTNAQYVAFVKATQHEAPQHWRGGEIPLGKEDHPVVWVSWDDAVAFCKWLSQETGRTFRLPTEAEWEKAARGTDGRIYPWGNEWDKTKLNSKEGGPGGTTPVGQYSPAGDSPYGAADMSGNVWEWCADWLDEEEYQRRAKSTVQDPQGPDSGKYFKRFSLLGDGFRYRDRVRRGGSWSLGQHWVRSAYRSRYGQSSRDFSSGFRVVVSPV